MSVRKFPGLSDGVGQVDLESLMVSHHRALVALQDSDKKAADIMQRLSSGAEVEAGSLSVEVRRQTVGHVRHRGLFINDQLVYAEAEGSSRALASLASSSDVLWRET